MKKKDDTLRKAILDYARDLIKKDGPESISIRLIAKHLGIATGTFYNYFENKNEILLALTEEHWHSTLMDMHSAVHSDCFYMNLREIYGFLYNQIVSSAGLLMASLQEVELIGKSRMALMQNELRKNVVELLNLDKNIKQNIWTDSFLQEDFANFILTNVMTNLRMKSDNIEFLIAITKRILY